MQKEIKEKYIVLLIHAKTIWEQSLELLMKKVQNLKQSQIALVFQINLTKFMDLIMNGEIFVIEMFNSTLYIMIITLMEVENFTFSDHGIKRIVSNLRKKS